MQSDHLAELHPHTVARHSSHGGNGLCSIEIGALFGSAVKLRSSLACSFQTECPRESLRKVIGLVAGALDQGESGGFVLQHAMKYQIYGLFEASPVIARHEEAAAFEAAQCQLKSPTAARLAGNRGAEPTVGVGKRPSPACEKTGSWSSVLMSSC